MPRLEYIDVLIVQRDLRDARVALIDTKVEQLAAVVNAYQALGGGVSTISTPADFHGQFPYLHTVRDGENFWTISLLYYRSGRYGKALWAANKEVVPAIDRLTVGCRILIPPVNQLDPALIEELSATAPPVPAPPVPDTAPGDEPANPPPPPPPRGQAPGPLRPGGDRRLPPGRAAGGADAPAASPIARRRRGAEVRPADSLVECHRRPVDSPRLPRIGLPWRSGRRMSTPDRVCRLANNCIARFS